jgi:hypothetical protein
MKRIFFLVFFILIFQNVQAENLGLSEAYEVELINRVKSVFSPQPPETKTIPDSLRRPVCATPIFLEIRHNWDRFSAKTKAILESYNTRPTYNFEEHTYDTPQGHFKIHYVVDGDSAVPSEGWVDTCGEVLEHVWDTETDVLGYNEPPSDDWYEDNGGDGRYDVYLLGLSKKYLGYTVGEYFLSPQTVSATSFIVLDNDYVGYGSHTQIQWLQVTFAHEFFHAIQMGYDATEYEYENECFRPYWMEMSAVWMEEMVYDDVNDYLGYLFSFFDQPWLSLKTFRSLTDFHPYGSCVWPIFLSERFDTLIIKDIWEKCAEVPGDNVFDPPSPEGKSATDKALESRGSNFEEAFREFTVWNYFTRERKIPGRFYEEGAFFDSVEVRSDQRHSQYPVPSTHPSKLPENLASNYVVFTPLDSVGGLEIDFDGQDDGGWRLSVVGFISTDYSPLIFETHLDTLQEGKSQIYNWFDYKEIVLIPAATVRAKDDYNYSYSARYDSSLHGEQLFDPWITIIPSNPVKTAFVDETLTFQVKVTDQNHEDTLTVEKTGVGDFEYTPGCFSVVGTFSWTPTAGDTLNSPYLVIFTANDGHGGTDEKQVRINVKTKPHQDVFGQNFPNPFVIHEHDSTFFPFVLSSISTTVDIWIFNIAGELVRKIPSRMEYKYGHYGVNEKKDLPFWDGKNDNGEYVSSGIYLYRVRTKNSDVIKKMAVIK